MTLNGWQTIEAANDNLEASKRKIPQSILTQAQKDFISRKVDGVSKPKFINCSIQDFLQFVNSESQYRELWNTLLAYNDEQKNNIESQLKIEFFKQIAERNQNIKTLLWLFNEEYELDTGQKNKLIEKIHQEWNTAIIDAIRSESLRNRFIRKYKIYWDSGIKMRDDTDFDYLLQDIDINNLTDTTRASFEKAIYSNDKLTQNDITLIIWPLKPKNQIRFLKDFLPQIQLRDIVKYHLLSNSDIQTLLREKFQSEARDVWVDITTLHINPQDYLNTYISTKDLDTKTLEDIIAWNSNILWKIADEINAQKTLWRQDRLSDYDENIIPEWPNEDIHKQFIEFIRSQAREGKISSQIWNNIEKLRTWGYLRLTSKDTSWQARDASKQAGYYKITGTDVWTSFETKALQLKNVSHWEKSVRKDSEVHDERRTYKSMYELFLAEKWQENMQIDILSQEEFDALGLDEVVLGNIETKADLKSKLDMLDPAWVHIVFQSWMFSIHDTSCTPPQSFDVTQLTDAHITLNSSGTESQLTLEEFYTVYESRSEKLSRVERIQNYDSCVKVAEQLKSDAFAKIALHDETKELVLKSQKSQKKGEVESIKYFIWEDGDAIQIDNIDENSISYTLGKIEEKSWKDSKWKKFTWQYKCKSWNDFLLDIKHHKMSPDTSNAYKSIPDHTENAQMKWGILWAWLKCLSISDILTWWNQIVEWLKQSFERWDRLKAAKFAESISGIIPMTKNMKLELQMHKEKIEKDTIQEMIDSMKNMGSKRLIEKVEWIITNSNSQEYEIIACLFTVAEKYGDLYPKDLVKYEKSRIWFTRLGGNKYPEIVTELRKEVDNPDKKTSWKQEAINFTEDELVFRLLSKRVDLGTIRSKMNKDYRKALNIWVEDEIKDGTEKVAEQFTTQWKIDHIVGEIKNRWFANALWGMEKSFKKYGDPVGMQASPFIFTFCGSWPELLWPLKSKTLWLVMSTPYASLWFALNPQHTKLYQDTIIRVFEKRATSWDTKASDLRAILNMPFNKRPEQLANFWAKHGKELAKIINFTDPYIFLHKDEEPLFAEFFDVMNGFLGNDEHKIDRDELDAWVYTSNPTVFAWKIDELGNSDWGWLDLIQADNNLGFWRNWGEKITVMYFTYLQQIRENNTLSVEDKKKIFLEVFPKIENALRLSLRWWAKDAFEKFPWAPVSSAVRNNNLDLFRWNASQAKVWNAEYDAFLDTTWENFYRSRWVSSTRAVDSVAEYTTVWFNDILNWANDTTPPQN